MSDDAALMAAIRDIPDDDLARLAYADWLLEHGDEARAEFIRIELALERLPAGDERRQPLRRREIALIRQHKDRWFGTFRSEWSYYDCRRGFIEEVTAPATALLPHVDWLYHHHVVQVVTMTGTLAQAGTFLRHPLVGVLRRATLHTGAWSTWPYLPADAAQTPLACRPLQLQLFLDAGKELIAELKATPYLARLGYLDLSSNRLGLAGVMALLHHLPAWPMLTRLALRGRVGEHPSGTLPNIGAAGIVAVAQHPAVRQVRVLDLSYNRIDETAARALVDSPYLAGIEELILKEPGGQLRRVWREMLEGRFASRLRIGQ